ncbi:hypothetical protein jhhlp_008764 [Lomentospora prolificans]|uniref:Uncharacterized protein n=1 Tax=Lomentospora prolificans TaxID=41688 RepID=A0A2N3MYZ0_9PEZI|nr:hypothetical protein jhhlp_008764 [Lomentospora prolificans]
MDSDNASESAPAYDQLFASHPINQQPPRRGFPKAYAPLAQEDDPEEQPQPRGHQHLHYHNGTNPEAANIAEDTPMETVNGGARVHVHCEVCDRIAERRERRQNERHCCSMVTTTFIMAFVCLMVLGIVVVSNRRHAT